MTGEVCRRCSKTATEIHPLPPARRLASSPVTRARPRTAEPAHHRYQSAVLLGSRPPPAPLRGHGGGAARRGALVRAAARAPRRWSRWRLESVRGVQRAACSRLPRRVLQWVDRVEHGPGAAHLHAALQHCSLHGTAAASHRSAATGHHSAARSMVDA